jgi:hypothetical protein
MSLNEGPTSFVAAAWHATQFFDFASSGLARTLALADAMTTLVNKIGNFI